MAQPIETRVPEIVVGNTIPFVAACVFVVARIYTRAGILKIFPAEDWFLVIGWVTAIGHFISCMCIVRWGAGRHLADIPFSWIKPELQSAFAQRLLYQVSNNVTKISLCVMYLRIFGVQRRDRFILWACNFILGTSLVGLIVFNFLRCSPLAKFWDYTLRTGRCLTDVPGFWVSVGVGIGTDLILLIFSAWKVHLLHVGPRQKLVMYVTVGLGWLTVAAASLRAERLVSAFANPGDVTWRLYDATIWPSVELCVGLICTSAITLKPLIRQVAPGLMAQLSGGTGDATSGMQSKSKPKTIGSAHGVLPSTEDVELGQLDGKIMKASEFVVVEEDEGSLLRK